MSDPIKTGQPVPLWYEVVAEFSDDHETVREAWNQERFARSSERAWYQCVEIDKLNGIHYDVTVTVIPKYVPRED